jgi:hypothetical protein
LETVSSTLVASLYEFGTLPLAATQEKMVRTAGDYLQWKLETWRDQWNYDHMGQSILTLLQKYEGCNVFLFNEEEPAPFGAVSSSFKVVNALIVPAGESPPPIVFRKGLQSIPLVPFEDLHLDWVALNRMKIQDPAAASHLAAFFDQCGGRVFGLMHTGRTRTMRTITEETEEIYKQGCLLDARTAKFPKYKTTKKGETKIEVLSASFGVTINGKELFGMHTVGAFSLTDTLDEFIEKNEANGVDDSHREMIKEAVASAFEAKRQIISTAADMVRSKYEKVDDICVAKIYPKNINEVAPIAAKQIAACRGAGHWILDGECPLSKVDELLTDVSVESLIEQYFACAAEEGNPRVVEEQEKQLADFKALLANSANYKFTATTETAQYGPAKDADVFPTYVIPAPAGTSLDKSG